MRILKEKEFEVLLKEGGYVNYYLENPNDLNSYIFDSTKNIEIADELGIKYKLDKNEELVFIVPKGTIFTIEEFIDNLKIEIVEGECLDNAIDFLSTIIQEELSMEELTELASSEYNGENIVNLINVAIKTRGHESIIELLDLIKNSKAVHQNLYNFYFGNGDLYYCSHCGQVVNLNRDYLNDDKSVICHLCILKGVSLDD